MEKQRNYTKEFKVQVCELVLKENIKVKIVAARVGINTMMLCVKSGFCYSDSAAKTVRH